MFKDATEQTAYVVENYPEVTDHRINDDHWDLLCTHCKVTRGFQVVSRITQHQRTHYHSQTIEDGQSPVSYWFKCPVCKTYKQWVMFRVLERKRDSAGNEPAARMRYFRVTSIPNEGLEEITELPTQPASLREAYRQAVRAMDANAHLAAAAMFRRALQVITRDVLRAKPGNLANELRECVGKTLNGVTVTSNFSSNGYVIKEAGNQGAHPDNDPDLLDFTAQDAVDLQAVFLELVAELFVVPAAVAKARADFLQRRKIN